MPTQAKAFFDEKGAEDVGDGIALGVAAFLGSYLKNQAMEYVKPGVGPGPHPHRTEHEDTGHLMESITLTYESESKNKAVANVSTDVDYGVDLEIGWLAPSRKFYKYPWLWPSLKRTAREIEAVGKKVGIIVLGTIGVYGPGGDLLSESGIPPGYLWNPTARRFFSTNTGKFVSRAFWEAKLREYHAQNKFRWG